MKVLVVDDSQLNLAIAQQYLNAITAITQIFVTTQPQKVKEIVDEQKIDILILDIIMPEITGIDLLALFRSDKQYDDIPIIMLTSLDDMDSYQKCYDLGAFDYINKPIKPIELNARLKVAIESKNNSNNLKAMVEVTKKQN
ncbi:MAG: response regulator, partial [Mobilitalea sp.]